MVNFVSSSTTFQLPPAPQIELVIDNPHLQGVLKRPLVRVRSELFASILNPSLLPNYTLYLL